MHTQADHSRSLGPPDLEVAVTESQVTWCSIHSMHRLPANTVARLAQRDAFEVSHILVCGGPVSICVVGQTGIASNVVYSEILSLLSGMLMISSYIIGKLSMLSCLYRIWILICLPISPHSLYGKNVLNARTSACLQVCVSGFHQFQQVQELSILSHTWVHA